MPTLDEILSRINGDQAFQNKTTDNHNAIIHGLQLTGHIIYSSVDKSEFILVGPGSGRWTIQTKDVLDVVEWESTYPHIQGEPVLISIRKGALITETRDFVVGEDIENYQPNEHSTSGSKAAMCVVPDPSSFSSVAALGGSQTSVSGIYFPMRHGPQDCGCSCRTRGPASGRLSLYEDLETKSKDND